MTALKLFLEQGLQNPETAFIDYLDEHGDIERSFTYGELNQLGAALSGFLREKHQVRPGDRVLLVFPPGPDFAIALAGCLYAGAIAVPVYPPNPMRADRGMRGFAKIVADCGASVALTNRTYDRVRRLSGIKNFYRKGGSGLPDLTWVTVDKMKPGSFDAAKDVQPRLEDLALLQYTSGSTSDPKGVMVTHANLLHQFGFNKKAMKIHDAARAVCWVPQYHDFGLIGCILSVMCGTCALTMMSPLSFIKRPGIWLASMSRYRGTHAATPNFGLAVSVQKTTEEERAGWDLSHVEVINCAAEPINHATVEAFYKTFAPQGLKRESFYPAYGLAEMTVGVTIGGRLVHGFHREPLERDRLVQKSKACVDDAQTSVLYSCGPVTDDFCVRIVDPETQQLCPPNGVGEIWIDSESKGKGYWGKPALSEDVFHARIKGSTRDRSFLRTGDMGFLVDGELFICGRLKDLLIVAGRNVYPQDLEDSARDAHAAIRPGGVVAFGVQGPSGDPDRFAILVETSDKKPTKALIETIIAAVRQRILEDHKLPCAAVLVGPPGAVLKTTSGKVQRHACSTAYAAGQLNTHGAAEFSDAMPLDGGITDEGNEQDIQQALTRWKDAPPASRHETLTLLLRQMTAETLALSAEAVDLNKPLQDQGLSSIQAMALTERFEELLDRKLSPATLFNHPSINQLARVLSDTPSDSAPGAQSARGARTVAGAMDPGRGRIVIVGGGCAGLTAAYQLYKNGHRQITVLEAAPQVGGKICTTQIGETPVDMGQVIFCDHYRASLNMLQEVLGEIDFRVITNLIFYPDTEKLAYLDIDNGSIWWQKVLDAAGLEPGFQLPLPITPALSESSRTWLAKHHLTEVPDAVRLFWEGFGYGAATEDIPIYYLIIYMRNVLPLTPAFAAKQGNRSLWIDFATKLAEWGISVQTNTPVKAIHRGEEGVRIDLEGGGDLQCDEVVLACPPYRIAELLDTDAEEQKLWQAFDYYDYMVQALRVDNLPSDWLMLPDPDTSFYNGRLISYGRVSPDDNVFITAQYGSEPGRFGDLDQATLEEQLLAGLRLYGGEPGEPLAHYRWRMFPHLRTKHFAVLDQIAARQGKRRSWFIGSWHAVETVEATVADTLHFIDQAFPAAAIAPAYQVDEPIAVVGMACRFPRGIETPEAYWAALAEGADLITEVPADRWDADAWYDPDPNQPGKCTTRWGGFLNNIDQFEPGIFGISPKEAPYIDPQQRLLLECSWEALERAGMAPQQLQGSRTGVYMGISTSEYQNLVLNDPNQITGFSLLGTAHSTSVGRISYLLGLQGPNMPVDTACSSGLTAVHLACQSLRTGESTMALAGGVNAILSPHVNVYFSRLNAMSPSGHCHTFGAAADGYVRSEGCGVVVLKRLRDAQRDGDPILAIIHGSAANQDGSSQGPTAPNGQAQQAVIRQALQNAGCDGADLQYVECHGTGTPIGDPIEVEALAEVCGQGREQDLIIGSVKTNIGHTEAAAGMAGLIKTVLAVQHEQIPPTLHSEPANPRIPWDNLQVRPARAGEAWPRGPRARYAGVSAFGFSGTNVHVVLGEAEPVPPQPSRHNHHLLPLSAAGSVALETLTGKLCDHLLDQAEDAIADVAHSLQNGRSAMACRRFTVVSDRDDALDVLEMRDPARLLSAVVEGLQPRVAFMFSGVGDQYPDMARELFQTRPVFAEALTHCCALLRPHMDRDPMSLIFSEDGEAAEPVAGGSADRIDLRAMLGAHREKPSAADTLLRRTCYAQPIVFAVDYAMAKLWLSLGVEPAVMIGHSVGEWVAAHFAGVLSLEDAAALVAKRARLIDACPEGGVCAVQLSETELQPLLGEELDVSSINAPNLCVVAGPVDALDRFEQRIDEDDIGFTRIAAVHAYHSRMLEPAAAQLRDLVAAVDLKPPTLPFISNTSGTWITDAEAVSPDYWARHLCSPVRFSAGLAALVAEHPTVLLEVGAGQALTTFAHQQFRAASGHRQQVIPSIRNRYDRLPDNAFWLHSVGRLWLAGLAIDWPALYQGEKRRTLSLPTYPFERSRFWFEGGPDFSTPERLKQSLAGGDEPLATRPLEEWFYRPVWQKVEPTPAETPQGSKQALVYSEGGALSQAVIDRYRADGWAVCCVHPGDFALDPELASVHLSPDDAEHHARLFKALAEHKRSPDVVVYLWGLKAATDPSGAKETDRGTPDEAEEWCFYRLLSLCQAIANHGAGATSRLVVVTRGAWDADGRGTTCPEGALASGLVEVLPLEQGITQAIHLDLAPHDEAPEAAVDAVIRHGEQAHQSPLALRDGELRQRHFALNPLAATPETGDDAATRFRHQGVYLITGGLGGIGAAMARFLAEQYQARLVLVGRSEVPQRASWQQILNEDPQSKEAARIRTVEKIEALGGKVLACAADVADAAAMARVFAQADSHFGGLNGIVHAAGVAGAALLQRHDREMAAAVLAAKVSGTKILAQRTADQNLDFIALFGSAFSVVPTVGQSSYASANAFMDAFAAQAGKTHVVTISWGAWQWDAWQSDLLEDLPELQRQSWMLREQIGISFEQGTEAFRRAVNGDQPHLVAMPVSPEYLQRLVNDLGQSALGAGAQGTTQTHQRPALLTPFTEPRNPIETELAAMWAQVLGVDRVGIHDNFLELGGTSLLGVQILNRLQTTYGLHMPMQRLFEKPTVAGLAEAVSASAAAVAATPVQLTTTQPTTGKPAPVQERLWYLHQLSPENPGYHMAAALTLTGPLDTALLARALQTVVARHDSLRAAFMEEDGAPKVVYQAEAPLHLETLDFGAVPAEARDDAYREQLQALVREPFDLGRPPLMRVRLLAFGEQQHILMLVIHHIVSDLLSMPLLTDEVAACYRAWSEDQAPVLRDLPSSYADFAAYHQHRLNTAQFGQVESYWNQRFQTRPPLCRLPTDHPRPDRLSGIGHEEIAAIPPALFTALEGTARAQNATLYMTMLAAFEVLLHAYSGETDLVVGTPVTLRDRPEYESMVGLLFETSALRISLAGNPDLTEITRRVRDALTAAYDNRDMPFDRLVRGLPWKRDLAYSPLFQVMFGYQELPGRQQWGPTAVAPRHVPRGASMVDVALFVRRHGEDAHVVLEYSADLFESPRMRRMLARYLSILEDFAANPNRTLDQMHRLPQAERALLLETWNQSERPRAPLCLHQRFEIQAAATPDAVALISQSGTCSYRALEQQSNQLAHWLIERGAAPEQRIGICMSRSRSLVVALLAVLKAGAAYVPFDPKLPPGRIRHMLDDAAPLLIIAEQARTAAFDGAEVPVVTLEELADEIPRLSDRAPRTGVSVENLMYLMYTSGSSGVPKAVAVTHANTDNLIDSMAEGYGFGPDTRFLQRMPFHFDASVWGFYRPLLSGATLVLMPESGEADPAELVTWIEKHRVTGMMMVPSLLGAWLSALTDADAARCAGLTDLFVGGEALSREHRNQCLARFKANLHNLYGPTETSVHVLAHNHRHDSPDEAAAIGRPISNARIYILDHHHRLCPVGVPGTLYVGGLPVTRGYFGDPAKTAAAFLPDPFTDQPGLRMYRTGDLGVYRESGLVDYLGREDAQIKLRGYRIELGEIEAVLQRHETVSEAAVLLAKVGQVGSRIIAHVAATSSEQTLHDHLAAFLPAYMVPSNIIIHRELPRGPSGKIDRRRLAETALDQPQPVEQVQDSALPAANRDSEYQKLLAVWCDLLELDPEDIGPEDGFFELGGDSILTIHLISKARKQDIHLSPAQFVGDPTIDQLLATREGVPAQEAPAPAQPPASLTPLQQWFLDLDPQHLNHFNMVVSLAMRERKEPDLIARALQSLVAHYPALSMRFLQDGAAWRQEPTRVPDPELLTVVDGSAFAPEAWYAEKTAVGTRIHQSFDISTGRLFKAVLFRNQPDQADELVWIVHHLIVDVVSLQFLADDLQSLIHGLEQGTPHQLAPPTTPAGQYADRLKTIDWFQSGETAFWQHHAQAPPVPVPRDFEAGQPETEATDCSLLVGLDEAETRILVERVMPTLGAGVFECLIAALTTTLAEWCGHEDVQIGLEGHGRGNLFGDEMDLTRSVGWFTTVYPMRFTVDRNGSPTARLKRVQAEMRGLRYQGQAYSVLRYLRADDQRTAALRRHPEPQVYLDYIGRMDALASEDSLFYVDPNPEKHETYGPTRAPELLRPQQTVVMCSIQQGCLRVLWQYSSAVHRRETAAWAAATFIDHLRAFIAEAGDPRDTTT
ncbi:non-ribosomal peptide synthetase/type I polyketide synthase [Acanthopleuribacter pedis]|uniref:Amino acid adenylation domain-containing protein n=1 Tax=Acanthopleuribacter pedis TaxID=442870 RepID=A0A8J7U8Z8_9BACT|nr:non-ribosomal peptide synthetase/type I polyketide synthase [Acanthopleuribacter pedis]MBO1323121.1 amino acid adenylation domain-containing protein [Acanthopleuribacter pedis]